MNLHTHITEDQSEVLGHIGWKYYNSIKKKAMEQEFSLSGLILSLSIAFFIVISAALLLNFFYTSIESTSYNNNLNNSLYKLEFSSGDEHFINTDFLSEDKLKYNRFSLLS